MYHFETVPNSKKLQTTTGMWLLSITRQQILDSSKLKEFADDNFKFDENGRKLSNWVENTVGKGVFKRLVSQGRQKVSLCGNGLKAFKTQIA